MNTILLNFVQLVLTLIVCILLTAYIRPHLKHLLTDLCGTEGRAQFWVIFTNILLILIPVLFGMGYHPESASSGQWPFELTRQMRINLFGFVLSLLLAGTAVGFFVLVAPKNQGDH